ncbi:MAG: amidohydrolase family protein, partial [Solirubrobacteraceae bacterium]
MAIDDGHFVAVGKDADVARYIGPKTRVVDLAGRMAMPGIHDMHQHPVQGGMAALFECTFPFATPLDGIVAAVRTCAGKTPKGEWIRGGQWAAETLESAQPPTAAMLDAAAPDNPVFLIDSTYHNAWLNSLALAKLGIDAKSANPSGGVILRDGSGAATGVLFDNAAYGAMKRLPLRTDAQYQ